MEELAKSIANEILRETRGVPRIGLVLGSGWGSVVESIQNRRVIPYSDLAGMPKCGVEGHAGNFVVGDLNGKCVVAVQGRFHLYEGRKMEEVLMPVRVLYEMGVRTILLTNAAGGVNEEYAVGDVMVIGDHINMTCRNPLIGVAPTEDKPIFVDMTHVYDEKIKRIILECCKKRGLRGHEGVYMQLLGPTFETPAEIRAFRVLGADAVGMSTVVEALYARYLKMQVGGVSFITNLAAGMGNDICHEDVLAQSEQNKNILGGLIGEVVANI